MVVVVQDILILPTPMRQENLDRVAPPHMFQDPLSLPEMQIVSNPLYIPCFILCIHTYDKA